MILHLDIPNIDFKYPFEFAGRVGLLVAQGYLDSNWYHMQCLWQHEICCTIAAYSLVLFLDFGVYLVLFLDYYQCTLGLSTNMRVTTV